MEDLKAITNRTQLSTGQLVTRGVAAPCAKVLPPFVPDAMLEERTDGWRLAEYSGTRRRVFVRLTGEGRWLSAWNNYAARVEFADVETEVAPIGDTFSIVAEVGNRTSFGWARVDAMT